MRIISGKFRNTKLFIPLSKETRPLKDITKESIFNTLIHFKKLPFKFKNAKILDLYSGTGSFGLECLSRDASKIIFVENNKNALKILQKNIYKLDIEKKTSVIEYSVLNYLSNIDNYNYNGKSRPSVPRAAFSHCTSVGSFFCAHRDRKSVV